MKRNLRILFLDDDQLWHLAFDCVMGDFLFPFTVIKEYDPYKAVNLIKENNFDCIITDYRMPKMNGNQFIEHIGNLNKKLPPIFGFTNEEDYQHVFFRHPSLVRVFPKDELKECLSLIYSLYFLKIMDASL